MTPRGARKGKTLLLVVCVIALAAFTADILDVREELYLLSCPNGGLDDDVSSGVIARHRIEPERLLWVPLGCRTARADITFLHLLPCGYRAPPRRS